MVARRPDDRTAYRQPDSIHSVPKLRRRQVSSRIFSRRTMLRGAGIALALPWMESLAPRVAGAQAPGQVLRFLPIFLPNGASENWAPQGMGSAWQLSGVLDSFADLKAKMIVISNLE